MLEKYRGAVEKCGRCGKCIVGEAGYICPVQQHTGGFDHYVARGRNEIARAILDGKLKYTPELVDVLYTCLGCKSCYVQCGLIDYQTRQPAIDESKISQAMRADIVREGLEPSALKAVDANVQKLHNPLGEPEEKRTSWSAGLNIPKTGDTLYFAGCYAAYRQPAIAKATVKVLQAGGVDLAYMGEDEWCCGVPELWDGNMALAEDLVKHNVEAMQKTGAKKVVTSCSGCYHTLKSEYPEIIGKLPFEVVHSSQVIAELIETGKINLGTEIAKTITYHDPCHLGRHENVYEQPRKALNAIKGAKFVEMPRNKANAWCCGGGSVVSTAFPDLAKDIAEDRIQEAKGTASEAIVTACPSCINMLTPAARKAKMEVYDLSVIVAKAMGLQI
jgi:heterodisulfide reductase subunit D